jgi:acetoin utilization deacetylase AcuC-like enzyme
MRCVYSDDHLLHDGLLRISRTGGIERLSEKPERASNVLTALRSRWPDELQLPKAHDDAAILAVHDRDYVEFLSRAWTDWVAAGQTGVNARADTFVGKGMRGDRVTGILGRLGRYAFDIEAPFVAGSWQAIRRSADIALTAAGLVQQGEPHAFALCRPPGHHATANQSGGYCYLNNSAIAAQSFLAAGRKRVAVLDVDYHHGNGTQSIFYERADVLTISLHASPYDEYPHFTGYEDEMGSGAGEGLNRNFALPLGTRWPAYAKALEQALALIDTFEPEVIVVPLGVDTYEHDETTRFGISQDAYVDMGRLIASLGKPTLVVLEGGYAIQEIGNNVVNFLAGVARENPGP